MIHVICDVPLKISNIVCQLFCEIFKSRYFMVTCSVAKILLKKLKNQNQELVFCLQGGKKIYRIVPIVRYGRCVQIQDSDDLHGYSYFHIAGQFSSGSP